MFLQFALDSPELLTRLRILEPLGMRSHNGRLADASIAREDLMSARLNDDYATLHRYDASGYTGQDRAMPRAVLERVIDAYVSRRKAA